MDPKKIPLILCSRKHITTLCEIIELFTTLSLWPARICDITIGTIRSFVELSSIVMNAILCTTIIENRGTIFIVYAIAVIDTVAFVAECVCGIVTPKRGIWISAEDCSELLVDLMSFVDISYL